MRSERRSSDIEVRRRVIMRLTAEKHRSAEQLDTGIVIATAMQSRTKENAYAMVKDNLQLHDRMNDWLVAFNQAACRQKLC